MDASKVKSTGARRVVPANFKLKTKFNGNKSELERVLEECRSSGRLWEDPDFPATPRSLFPRSPESAKDCAAWKRPSEVWAHSQLFIDGAEEGDIVQGQLGDCWFLSALSLLAALEGNHIAKDIFVAAHPEHGLYALKFYKDGEWRVVVIDDRIPFHRNGEPLFAMGKQKGELWVMLVEKAYAKLHGSYEAIEGGLICDGLVDLTGQRSEEGKIGEGNYVPEKLWFRLVDALNEGFLIGCSYTQANAGPEEKLNNGLLINHAYGVLDCKNVGADRLLRIRNPWGQHEWNGRWSDGAPEWTPDVKNILQYEFADDGTFWMCYEDFVTNFNELYVARLLNDDIGEKWNEFYFKDEWKGQTAGGCSNFGTWCYNPQYIIHAQENGKAFVSVMQPDERMPGSTPFIHIGIYALKTSDDYEKLEYSSADMLVKLSLAPRRELSIELELEQGKYYTLVASTYQPAQERAFTLAVYTQNRADVYPAKKYHRITLNGAWEGSSAGGCMNFPTWRDNPQFVLFTPNPMQLVPGFMAVQLEQEADPTKKEPPAMGFYIMKKDDNNPRLRKLTYKDGDVIKKSPFKPSASVAIPPLGDVVSTPLVIIPCTFSQGMANRFRVSVLLKADLGLRLAPIDPAHDWKHASARGVWNMNTAGGCRNNASFGKNTKYQVNIPGGGVGTVLVMLRFEDYDSKRSNPAIGFYAAPLENYKALDKLIVKSEFMASPDVNASFTGDHSSFVVIPCTFEPNQPGNFTLLVYSDAAQPEILILQ